MAQSVKRQNFSSLSCGYESHTGERLVADARNQQPFEPREWGLRVVLSGHFCASLHVGHARRKQASIELQIYLSEDQIKTNKNEKKGDIIIKFCK